MSWGRFKKNPVNKFSADLAMGKSKLERAVDDLYVLREKAGEIKDLKRQVTLVLQDGPREQRITWRVDFGYVECATEQQCYGEAKGFVDREYKLKLKLFRARPLGKLEIWQGTYRNPKLVEVINP